MWCIHIWCAAYAIAVGALGCMSATGVEVVATIDVLGLDALVSSVVVGRMLCCPPENEIVTKKTHNVDIRRK